MDKPERPTMRISYFLLLAACNPVTPCGAGFQRADDGSCYAYDDIDPAADTDEDGFVAADDCDDDDAAVNPAAEEVCNDIDDDCDGEIDGEGATGAMLVYADLDEDGYGSPDTATWACSESPRRVNNSLDCDDSKHSVSPSVLEISSDGIDQDCDGADRLTRIIAVSDTNGCAITASGSARCWGSNDNRVVSDVPVGVFMEIGAGSGYACALSLAGEVTCWGSDEHRQVSDAPDGLFVRLSVGAAHACVIDAAGLATCWGDDSGWAVSAAPYAPVKALSAGWGSSCAILAEGGLDCWGDNHRSGEPLRDMPAGTHLAVYVGYDTACAIGSVGQVRCWGTSNFSSASGSFSSVAVDFRTACAINGLDELECWGADDDPLLRYAPEEAVRQVAMGGRDACAMSTRGEVLCWGSEDLGQAYP